MQEFLPRQIAPSFFYPYGRVLLMGIGEVCTSAIPDKGRDIYKVLAVHQVTL
jgi:hypothetical protein